MDKLKDDFGQWQSWDTGLKDIITTYFTDIFTSRGVKLLKFLIVSSVELLRFIIRS